MVPALDDGARSVDEGLELCRLALEAGSTVVFATPHVHATFDSYPWTAERQRVYESALAEMQPVVRDWGLDLRGGAEVFPTELRGDQVASHVLEGAGAMLIECPGDWLTTFPDPLGSVARAAEIAEAAGLLPVLAHPERCGAARAEPQVLRSFVDRGWVLCVNAPSLLGDHGRVAERAAWSFLELGIVGVAASDGHRASRPPTLDRSFRVVSTRLGEGRARDLFRGAALGFAT